MEAYLERWRDAGPPLNLISITELNRNSAEVLLELASEMKRGTKQGREFYRFDRPIAAAMIFEKPSLRTRVTFEIGLYQMGGHAVYLTQNDIQMGRREAVMDVARNLGRWAEFVIARVYLHSILEELAIHTGAPIINALSDVEHPCQALADLLTIRERKGAGALKLAWVGDGNNVCHSFALLGAMLGHQVVVATPKGFAPDAKIVGHQIALTNDPAEAARDADVVYTDVWVSMGFETEREIRMRAFKDFQVNSRLLSLAKPDAIVLHCLPAHRDEEITSEAMDGPQSAIWDQAENRLHAQKALMALIPIPPENAPPRPS